MPAQLFGCVLLGLAILSACHDDPSGFHFSSARSLGFIREEPGHDPIREVIAIECWKFAVADEAYFRSHSNLASKAALMYSLTNTEAKAQASYLWKTLLTGTGHNTSSDGARTSAHALLVHYADGTIATVIVRQLTGKLGEIVAAEAKVEQTLVPIETSAIRALVTLPDGQPTSVGSAQPAKP